jgi:hypothetical protein
MSNDKIKLAKALKLKNKLAGELAKIKGKVREHNSYPAENKPNYDAGELWEEYTAKSDELIDLKQRIAGANVAIYSKIYRISELKDRLGQLRRLPTKEGTHKELDWSGGERTYINKEYHAVFSDVDVDEMSVDLENEIERLQDEIDEYNHSTMI